jgi:Vanin C-terminal domain
LAAGLNIPSRGTTGSGIYQGRSKGEMVAFSTSFFTSALLIANVEQGGRSKLIESNQAPEPLTENFHDKEMIFTSDKLDNYTSVQVPKNLLSGTITGCNNGFCCNLTFSISEKDVGNFHYQLLVFDGIRTHKEGRYETEMQVCALVACADDSLLSCTKPFSESAYSKTTVFDQIKIEAIFKTDYLWHNTLDSNTALPIDPSNYKFTVDKDFNAAMEIAGVTQNLHTFGIYSHDYLADLAK